MASPSKVYVWGNTDNSETLKQPKDIWSTAVEE